VLRVLLALLVHKADRVLKVFREILVPRDLLDLRVRLVLLDLKVTKVFKVFKEKLGLQAQRV
jgi:uncharacterized protein YggT (Ycf19 family)